MKKTVCLFLLFAVGLVSIYNYSHPTYGTSTTMSALTGIVCIFCLAKEILATKKKCKNKIIYICVTATFLIQLARGFNIPQQEQGQMASGFMNAPIAIVFSAILSGLIVWMVVEAIFWLVSKIKNTKN